MRREKLSAGRRWLNRGLVLSMLLGTAVGAVALTSLAGGRLFVEHYTPAARDPGHEAYVWEVLVRAGWVGVARFDSELMMGAPRRQTSVPYLLGRLSATGLEYVCTPGWIPFVVLTVPPGLLWLMTRKKLPFKYACANRRERVWGAARRAARDCWLLILAIYTALALGGLLWPAIDFSAGEWNTVSGEFNGWRFRATLIVVLSQPVDGSARLPTETSCLNVLKWGNQSRNYAGRWFVEVHVLIPLAALLLPLPFWLRRLRRAKLSDEPEACQTCGYNLTGNVSGVCPECGTAIYQAENSVTQAGESP